MKSDFTKNLSQIGGRWAISFRAGLMIFPLTVLSIPILEANLHNLKQFLLWTLISFLATLPAALVLYLAHLTYFKNRAVTARPAYTVFVLGFLLGAIKGSLLEILALAEGLTHGNPASSIAIRTLNSAVLGGITIPLISLNLVTSENFKIQRGELLEQLAFLRTKNAQILKLNSSIEEVTPNQLRTLVNDLLSQTKEAFKAERLRSDLRPETLIALLNKAAEDIIRPLSHTFHEKSLPNPPKLSAIQFLKVLSNQFQIEVSIIVGAYVIFSFKNLFVSYGLVDALILVTWKSLLLLSLLFVFKALFFSPSTKKLKNSFLLITIAIAIIFVTIESIVSTTLGYETDAGKISLSVIWVFLIIFVTGLLASITDVNKFQLNLLREQIDSEEQAVRSKELQQRYLYRSYSKILHGVYHSRLLACAVAIGVAAQADNRMDLEKEMDRAESLLEIDFETHMVHGDTDITSLLKELIEKWSGTLDITTMLGRVDGLTSFQLLALHEFLLESFTNAFRHGRATHATVDIQLDSRSNLHATVTDDGVGYIPSVAGLGTAIYNEISHGNWSIKSRKGASGTIVKIVIPTEEFM